jgi:hypothetical protein
MFSKNDFMMSRLNTLMAFGSTTAQMVSRMPKRTDEYIVGNQPAVEEHGEDGQADEDAPALQVLLGDGVREGRW